MHHSRDKIVKKKTDKKVEKYLKMQFKYLLLYRFKKVGELAHLARALDWQSKGDGFDPRILHSDNNRVA